MAGHWLLDNGPRLQICQLQATSQPGGDKKKAPEVSVCLQLAAAKAKRIRRKMKADEDAAKLALLTKSGDASSAAKSSKQDEFEIPARRPLDVFVQFVHPETSGAVAATNTRGHRDAGAKPDALSSRAKPPPVPFLRTISL